MLEVSFTNDDVLMKIKEGMPQAFARALNRTGAEVKTDISTKVRETYNIKKSDFDATYRMKKANDTSLYVIITNQRKKIALPKFGVSWTKKMPGAVVEVIRGQRHTLRHTFLATMKSGHKGVYIRRGLAPRLPVRELKGLSAGQMMAARRVLDKILPTINEIFYKNVDAEMNYESIKNKNK